MALQKGQGNQYVQQLLRSERSGPPPTLRVGSRGAAVRTLQARLAGKGASIAADGIFGPRTDAAVRAFQRSSGLQTDGIAGPQTWKRLLGRGGGKRGQVPAKVRELYRKHQALTGRVERQRVDIAGKLETAALLVAGAASTGAASPGVTKEAKAPPPASSAHGWLDDAEDWLDEQADDAGDWVDEQVDDASDWVEEQVDEVSDWVEEQADDASDWVEEQVDDASDWVEEQVDDASDWVNEQVDDVSDWVEEQVDDASDWVEEQVDDASEVVDDLTGEVADEIRDWVSDPIAKANDIYEALEEDLRELHNDARRKLNEIREAAGSAADELLERLEDILGGLDRPVGLGTDLGDVSAGLEALAKELKARAGGGKGELKAGASKTEINVKSGTRKVSAPSIRALGDKLGGSAGWVEEKPTQISFAFDPDDEEKKVLQAELAFDVTKTMPDWEEASKQSPADLKKYQNFLAALNNHEEGHVSRYRDGLTGLHKRLLGLPESSAETKYDAARDAADAANVQYDSDTNHGLDQSPSTRIP